MENLIVFLLQAVVISLSGVMAPGPITAAALAAGVHSRHAGARIALGHGIIEFPLMLFIVGGMGTLLASERAQIGIGLAGGAFLIFMGLQMFRTLRLGRDREGILGPAFDDVARDTAKRRSGRDPIWTGIILTGGNPYFLIWWATVGLALTSRALELSLLAFGLFAIAHWLCDLVWLEALSWASFKGSKLLGDRSEVFVQAICALALLFFGVMFIYGGAHGLQPVGLVQR
ncbi:MAG: LysE family transporter [Phycisphaerae bacterium]